MITLVICGVFDLELNLLSDMPECVTYEYKDDFAAHYIIQN